MSKRILTAIAITLIGISAWLPLTTQAHSKNVPYFQNQVDYYPPPPRHPMYPYRRFTPYFRPYVRGYELDDDYIERPRSWVRCSYGGIPYGAKVIAYNQGNPVYRCKGMYGGTVYYGETYGTQCFIRYHGRYVGVPIYKVLVQ